MLPHQHARNRVLSLVSAALLALLPAATALAFTPSGLLEIHHINVQQGDCTLIIGPDGTRFLIDGGNAAKGNAEVVPYLQSLGITTSDELHYMLATHRDSDHLGGLDEVINAGYDVLVEVWDNGSSATGTQVSQFLTAASGTTAGPVTQMPLGTIVQLGGGATARCVASHGDVLGFGAVSGATNNENDMSVAILVQYGGFDYITAGDLGGGQWSVDNTCTGRTTGQVNVESPLAVSLMPGGGAALLTSNGVEVLDVNHHGSESSTNSEYMNLLAPRVAAINVGAGQGSTYHHPRRDVVENVLMAQASCITASAALVLQTEEGSPTGTNTSFAGYCSGDIAITTSGAGTFRVSGTGAVSQGPDERAAAGIVPFADFPLDGSSDTEAPVVTVNAPNGGESWQANSAQSITWTATDNIGVTSVDLSYSTAGAGGSFTTIATGEANDGVYAWTVPNAPSSNAFVKVVARDAAGNSGEDLSNAAFTITAPPALALHVHGLTVTNISSGGGRWNGRATITAHNQNHVVVSGVVVTGNWSGIVTQTGVTGTTNGSGVATIDSQKKKNPSGQFCFDVTNLALSGYTYDSASDVPQTPPVVCGPPIGQGIVMADPPVEQLVTGSVAEIRFSLTRPSQVRVTIYDTAGRVVERLADSPRPAGTHALVWEAARHPSGIYFYRIETDRAAQTRRLVVVR